MTTDDTGGAVRAWLIGWVARHLAIPEHAVNTMRPLDEFGLSSTDIVTLTGDLSEHVGQAVAPDTVFEYPTIAVLADHVSAMAAHRHAAAHHTPTEAVQDDDPVAVIGLGCRFPGAVHGPEMYWRLLSEGRDGIRRIPPGRWESYAEQDPEVAALIAGAAGLGGFLDDIAGFDAAFFGISPREATVTDPQQRLALEVTWEALEDAGIPPRALAGTKTGVFMAASAVEYLPDGVSAVDGWSATGSSMGVIANRISYLLGTRGPSMVVDTACSGSLVAIHLACRHLLGGDCDLAVAGGVNLLLTPAVSAGFTDAGVLSSDGRCKTFDEHADGYSRAEGCGVVVLKRLSAAVRDGDPVLAIVRGTAVNANGHSNGLMAPQPAAQEELLRTTYRAAGIDPLTIDFVETHGTGTALGDPMEVKALSAVLSPGRPADQPVLLGAVKTNLGHLEAAAGVAGFIKTVLALHHAELPGNLNLTTLNPRLELAARPLEVLTGHTAWPDRAHPRRAAVSSFGFGGANAHAVLEQAPVAAARPARADDGTAPIALVSASSTEGLRAAAEQLACLSTRMPESAMDIAHTLTLRRSHGPVRAGVLATDRACLTAGLRAIAAGEDHEAVVRGQIRDSAGPVFVFSGQGSQWTGMATALLDHDPDFTAMIDELEPVIMAESGFSLRAALASDAFEDVAVVQPALFAVQVALAASWQAHGVVPVAVIGHSMGEVAAAVVAGALSARDGAKTTCRRSALLKRIEGDGRMAVVRADTGTVGRWIRDEALDAQLAVAATLSPLSTVVSGSPHAIDRLGEVAAAAAVDMLAVQVNVASHSPQVDAILADVLGELAGIPTRAPRIPFYSTVSGTLKTDAPDERYWASNLRSPVLLRQAVAAAAESGHSLLLEVSPHPVLTTALADSLAAAGVPDPAVLGTLRRGADDRAMFALAAARLHCLGQPIAWKGAWTRAALVPLPPRRWDSTPYWHAHATGPLAVASDHPLLGTVVEPADQPGTQVTQADLRPSALAWLSQHVVAGSRIVPASVLGEVALAAAHRLGFSAVVIRDLVLHRPLPADRTLVLQAICRRDPGAAAATLHIHYRTDDHGAWTQCASARVHADAAPGGVWFSPDDVGLREVSVSRWYEDLAASGVEFGEGLRAVHRLRAAAGYAEAELRLPGTVTADDRYRMHPVLVNGAMQVIASAMPPGSAVPMTIAGFGSITRWGAGTPVRAAVRLTERGDGASAELGLWDVKGDQVALLTEVRLTPITGTVRPDPAWAHELTWRRSALPERAARPAETWLIVGQEDGLAAGLRRLGADFDLAAPGRLPAHRRARPYDRVLYTGALAADGDSPADALRLATESVELIQNLANSPQQRARLHFVTNRAQVLGDERDSNPAQAVLWGIGRSAALEHPGLWGGVLDLADAVDAEAVHSELLGSEPGAQAAYRNGERLVPVLQPRARALRAVVERTSGSHLLVGGTGRLAPHLLDDLAGRGARCVVVLSRAGLRGPAADRADRLRASGVKVIDARADIADRAALEAVFSRFGADLPPLRCVYHAVFDESIADIADLSKPLLAAMFRGKVHGLHTIGELAAAHGAGVFCFSSTTGLLGSRGLAHYAAASCYMDSFAQARANDGAPLWSVDFGPCADGIAGTAHEQVILASGLRLMPGRAAVAAVGPVLENPMGAPRLVLADADWPAIDDSFALALRSPLLAELAAVETTGTAPSESARTGGDRREQLREELRRLVADAMGADPAALNVQQNLFSLGMDSLMSLGVIRSVRTSLGHRLDPEVLLDRPTIVALADHLAEQDLERSH
ncbi:beta-ketoacyl synthase N-terminal-like domain-containing protein [Amycolatopsis sp. NPDC059657]|uniref:beta-ketoacyl synthase N-terminal-like domain-containing protein n=1 Tax=Amycolatopsis sp. NPDC059657 TaxID=3346899 RepID=UPI00366CE79A